MGLIALNPEWAPEERAAYSLVRDLAFFESEGCPRQDESRALDAVLQSFNELAAFYKPHHQLPKTGQKLWRELANILDQPHVDLLDLFHAIDEFRQWLVDQYQIGGGPDQRSRGLRKHIGRREAAETNERLLRLMLASHHRLGTDSVHFIPAKQEELAKLLKWNQPKVSRVMKRIFPKGMDGYKEACTDNDFSGLKPDEAFG